QVIELGPVGKLVDPREVDQEQLARIFGRAIEVIEIHRLAAVDDSHADEILLVTDNVDQLELLEERGERVKSLADLRPRLDRDAQRRSIVEDEAQERMSDQPFAPVRDIEIDAGQVRHRQIPVLIARREVIPASIFEIANARDVYAVAVDDRA